ncbi:GNAT family N-acetyltransferase [Salana multivorans]|uniref:GNAT family N-acetyltransferase n=1 Tax=Salana multivorans TaxID=120377 RepID=UPI000AC0D2FB|nr:GNAT family N-acetyltransferase [Salana multivorans]
MTPAPEAPVPGAPEPAGARTRPDGVGALDGLAGLTWRPLRAEDLAELSDLVARCERFDDPPYRTSTDELAGDVFEASDADLADGTIAGFDEAGRALAYGRVRRAGDGRSAVIGGGVDPSLRRRGIGSVILGWQLARARALVGELVTVTTYVEDGMGDQVAMLEEEGFTAQRRFTELRRDLSQPLPDVALRTPLTLEPWRSELDEQVRLAHNESFGDAAGAGAGGASVESWREGIANVVPEWSFLVMDRSTDRTPIAGYLLSGRYEQDWPALGYTSGYTDLLGVRREYRGRRVATALLVAAMRAYRDAGMEYACLGVDSALDDAESTLYGQLGFEATRGSTLWARTLA